MNSNDFMHTPDFRKHFVNFVQADTLMPLRSVSSQWKATATQFINEGVESGLMMVHDGKDISSHESNSRRTIERKRNVTEVLFLLNVTRVGDFACCDAAKLVVVDLPEGVEIVGGHAFYYCRSLTAVSFPATLKKIGLYAFGNCPNLDNVELLHTSLQEIGEQAFWGCSELKLMTLPESLRTLGANCFRECFNLEPSNILHPESKTSKIIADITAYLRTQPAFTEDYLNPEY